MKDSVKIGTIGEERFVVSDKHLIDIAIEHHCAGCQDGR